MRETQLSLLKTSNASKTLQSEYAGAFILQLPLNLRQTEQHSWSISGSIRQYAAHVLWRGTRVGQGSSGRQDPKAVQGIEVWNTVYYMHSTVPCLIANFCKVESRHCQPGCFGGFGSHALRCRKTTKTGTTWTARCEIGGLLQF